MLVMQKIKINVKPGDAGDALPLFPGEVLMVLPMKPAPHLPFPSLKVLGPPLHKLKGPDSQAP